MLLPTFVRLLTSVGRKWNGPDCGSYLGYSMPERGRESLAFISKGYLLWSSSYCLHRTRDETGRRTGAFGGQGSKSSRLGLRKLLGIDPCSSPAQFCRRYGGGCSACLLLLGCLSSAPMH